MVWKSPSCCPWVIKNMSDIVVLVIGDWEISVYKDGEIGDKRKIILMKPIGNAHNIDNIIDNGAVLEAPTVSSATNAAES